MIAHIVHNDSIQSVAKHPTLPILCRCHEHKLRYINPRQHSVAPWDIAVDLLVHDIVDFLVELLWNTLLAGEAVDFCNGVSMSQ